MNDTICIEYSLLKDNILSDSALAIYVFLKANVSKNTHVIYSNVSLISYMIYGKDEKRRKKDMVRLALQELEEKGFIETKDVDNNNNKKITVNEFNDLNADNFFTLVPASAFLKIMRIDYPSKATPQTAFRIYSTIISTRDGSKTINSKYRWKISTTYQYQLANLSRCSLKVLRRYIEILEENKLISVYHGVNTKENAYASYEDRNLLIDYVYDYIDKDVKKKALNFHSDSANEKRKYSQLYRHILESPDKYSDKDIKDVVGFYEALRQKESREKYDISLLNEILEERHCTF